MELLITYGLLYLKIGFVYVILYSFLKGLVRVEWEVKDLKHGILFPLSLANELGSLTSTLIQLVRKRKTKE